MISSVLLNSQHKKQRPEELEKLIEISLHILPQKNFRIHAPPFVRVFRVYQITGLCIDDQRAKVVIVAIVHEIGTAVDAAPSFRSGTSWMILAPNNPAWYEQLLGWISSIELYIWCDFAPNIKNNRLA